MLKHILEVSWDRMHDTNAVWIGFVCMYEKASHGGFLIVAHGLLSRLSPVLTFQEPLPREWCHEVGWVSLQELTIPKSYPQANLNSISQLICALQVILGCDKLTLKINDTE